MLSTRCWSGFLFGGTSLSSLSMRARTSLASSTTAAHFNLRLARSAPRLRPLLLHQQTSPQGQRHQQRRKQTRRVSTATSKQFPLRPHHTTGNPFLYSNALYLSGGASDSADASAAAAAPRVLFRSCTSLFGAGGGSGGEAASPVPSALVEG